MKMPLFDFRRSLGLHLDAIRCRDLDTYAASLSHDDTVLVAFPNAAPAHGRMAALRYAREWFRRCDWSFSPIVTWTMEVGDVALAMVNVCHSQSVQSGTPRDDRYALMFVFRKGTDHQWRAVVAARPDSFLGARIDAVA